MLQKAKLKPLENDFREMSRIRIRTRWLQLTEEINTLDYLEQAYHYIRQTKTKDIAWKWVVLTLHGALYGFAICALQGTNPDNVIFRTKKKGIEKLISFGEALKRCQDPKWLHRPVKLSNQQKESIRKLKHEFRNNFEHYVPKLWAIELSGMPQIAIDVLEVIRFLALDTGSYTRFNSTQKKKVKSIVFQSKRILKQIL